MKLPILEKLKEGERFDFGTLADNVEQTDEFLGWWWSEKYKEGVISRPEIIADNDPLLTPTAQKPTADLSCCPEFFDRMLLNATRDGRLPPRSRLSRPHYRELLLSIVAASSIRLSSRPQIVFTGGGYGSGKTTILNFLAQSEVIPVQLAHLVGVDVFKPLIPEYNLIKAVADGRASLTVQQECKELANELFDGLVGLGRSFAWDSSMSDAADTLAKMRHAKEHNYELSLIGVLTPLEVAIRQAMNRAKDSRRFPHPEALPKSHAGFRKALNEYIPFFDEVMVFARLEGVAEPVVVAEKKAGANELAILDEKTFTAALILPIKQP